MTSIGFLPHARALLRLSSVLVIAPKRLFSKDRLPKILDHRARQLLLALARDTEPGLQGTVGSTHTGRMPRRLLAGVLPNAVSRHNSPSRAEGIRRIVTAAGLDPRRRNGIVLVLEDRDHLLAAVNAVGRGLPQYTAKTDASEVRVQILAVDASGAPIEIPEVVESTLRASRSAAELVDTPPNELDPETFAVKAREQLAGIDRVRIKEITGDALLKQRLKGIHTVGRCATKPPRMLVASYDPKISKAQRVALVGKGITFDAGGLHLKARGMMETMKSDMGGAAAMLGAFSVLARTGCQHKLSLVLCMAENAIGPAAYKPDDILTLHSGKTVEINNTDAEGRLLLADGASYAARELRADVVFDAATLTGAQLIATGLLHAGVVSNDGNLEQLVLDAGRATGDLCHPLPFAPEIFKEEFSSPIADMKNSVENRANAQTSCAAQFVYWHIEDAPGARRRRWCHVDLAGPSFPRDRGTGFGVALISEAVRRL